MRLSPVVPAYRMVSQLRHRSSAASAAAATAGCPFHRPGKVSSDLPLGGGSRPFEAVPSPKGLPLIGTALDLIRSGGAAKIHEYCDRRHKELGPIFREKMGTMDVVVISSKEYIQRVYLSEGKFPVHLVPEPWVIYNEMRGIKRGLFFMDGDQWRTRRTYLNHILIPPKVAERHAQTFNEVVTDAIDRFGVLSAKEKDGSMPNLETELYNWSIETLGTMVFGRRLGCVMPADHESQMHEFVHYVQQIFTESAKMAIIPPKLASRFRLPVWRRFEKAADKALEMARGYVEERIAEINELNKAGEKVDGILGRLLAVEDASHMEIVNIVADLILAAADTTSHATQWALHSLAKNPEIQERLVSEINAVVPPGEIISESHLQQIPYMMWIIKETLRLYPIASFLTRVLPDKIVLGDYEIPAGKLFFMSQYTIGRDPERFPQPEKFMPERWQRTKDRSATSHACMPFGFGARSCIGRKVAELKMQLLIARTVQKFRLESANEKEVGIALRMITTPDQPIKIRFLKRDT